MKKVLPLFVFCTLSLVFSEAMAYTSTDCTNATQLATQGVISYRNSCNEYNLNRSITRQEVAAVALKVGETCGSISNIPPSEGYSCDNIFSDVSSSYQNNWACRAVETLARDGIVTQSDRNQYGDVFFRPLNNVSRSEALAMLLNAGNLEFQGVTYDDWRFTGTGAVLWQKPLMQYAYDRNIINSITAFGPNTNAFRRDVFNYATTAITLCRSNSGNNNNNTNNNNNCGIGQYRSGNSCYSCNTPPTNAYYPTQNSCVWTCSSGYYKSGNTCISNNTNNQNNLGQCGSTANSCIRGFSSNISYSGNFAYWNCTGTNGSAVSCNAFSQGNNFGTTGQCGNTANSCIRGFSSNISYSGNFAYWNCTGTNGSAVSCNSGNNSNCGLGQYRSGNSCYSCNILPTNAYYPTQNSCVWTCNSGYYKSGNTCISNNTNNQNNLGQCGSTANSCIRGFSSNISYSGNFAYWNCTGTNGSAVSCNANNNNNNCGIGQYFSGNMCLGCVSKPSFAYYTHSGTCDWTCNSGFYRSGNSCVSDNINTSCTAGQYLSGNICYSCGTAPWNAYYTNSGTCDWTCNSGFYRSGNTCISNNTNNQNNLGQCGSTANSCIRGFSSNISYGGNFAYWNCTGTNGVAVSCNANNNNNNNQTFGQCDTQVTNACTTGHASGLYYIGNTSYWNCTGSNGSAVSCSTYNYNNTYNSPAMCDRPISTNAYFTNNSNCWSCNAGFTLVGDLCVWWYN